MADEYIIELGKALYDPDTGAAVFKPEFREKLIRCRECRWWNDIGCAVKIVDDSDKPKADDFCSFGERKA